MKKIILTIISLSIITFIGYIYDDIGSNQFDDRSKLTHQTKCFLGDEKSCSFLVWFYGDYDSDEALTRLTKICDSTSQIDACRIVAEVYAFGNSKWTRNPKVETNATKAIYYYDRACKTKNRLVYGYSICRTVGDLYTDGELFRGFSSSLEPKKTSINAEKDFKKAIHYYEMACENNWYYACSSLATRFIEGQYKISQSSYYNPISANSKNDLAEIYLKKGCNNIQTYDDEIDEAALFCCDSLAALDIDIKEKSKIYDQICTYSLTNNSWDNGQACLKNGLLYLEGKGLRQDFKKAKEYFGKACDVGNEDGCVAYKKLNSIRQ